MTRSAPLALALALTSVPLAGCGITAFTGFLIADSASSSGSSGGAAPPPQVESVSPSQASHAGGVSLTIRGQGFSTDPDNPPQVLIGGQVAEVTALVGPDELRVTLPRAETTGPVEVRIANSQSGFGSLPGGLTYTNDPPVVSIDPLPPVGTGNLVLTVTIADPESDNCDLAFRYDDGSGFQALPNSAIVSGAVQNLDSTPGGVVHNLTWNTSQQFSATNAEAVILEVEAIDRTDGQRSAAVASAQFAIQNNTPPQVELIQPGDDEFDVAFTVRLSDLDPTDTLQVTSVTYTDLDRNLTADATLRDGTPPAVAAVSSGTLQSIVWQSLTDVGFGNNRLVQLTVTVSDGTQEDVAVSAPFFLDNGPVGTAMIQGAGILEGRAIALGDLTSDGLPDAVITASGSRAYALMINTGDAFQAPLNIELPGFPAPVFRDLTWNGTTTVACSPDPGDLAIGDLIGLPLLTPFGTGDPIGPRAFQITAVGTASVTIADPYGYEPLGLLPGSAPLGGPVGGLGGTLSFPDAVIGLSDPLVPNLVPGAVALLSVDDDLSSGPGSLDAVIVNHVPPLLNTQLSAAITPGASEAPVNVLAVDLGGFTRSFQVGQRILIGDPAGTEGVSKEERTVTALDTVDFELVLDAALTIPWPAGTPVFALDQAAFFLGDPLGGRPGHLANHSFTVLPRLVTGAFGVPQDTTFTGGLFAQSVVTGDLGSPSGAGPDGLTDLVIVSAASLDPPMGRPQAGRLTVLLRQPSGPGFAAPILLDAGDGGAFPAGSLHATIADITSDGLPDLIVANAGESSVSVFAQLPGNTFVETILRLTDFMLPPGDSVAVGVGDFDQDGFPDLVVGGALSQRLTLFRGADPDGGGPAVSFPGGDPLNPVLAVAQDPAPPPFVAGGPTLPVGPFLYTLVSPLRLAVGDITNDGLPDIVVPEAGNNRVTAFVNQGVDMGVLQFSAVGLTPSLAPSEVLIQDLGGDGRNDLLAFSSFLVDITRFEQTTAGTIDRFTPFPVGLEPSGISLGDVDPNTPGLEVVISNNGSNTLQILAQDGSGGLANLAPFPPARDIPVELHPSSSVVPQPFPAGGARLILPLGVDTGDFNGDGLTDVAFVAQALIPSPNGSGAVGILFNEGGVAPIRTTSLILTTDRQTFTLEVGDVLGNDGVPDLIVANRQGGPTLQGTLQIFRCNGDGTFQPPIEYDLPQGSFATVVDIDGDDDLDILAAIAGFPSNLVLLEQDPPGTLQAPTLAVPGGFPPQINSAGSIAAADYNQDGLLDLAIFDFTAGRGGIVFQDPGLTFSNFTPLLSIAQPISSGVGDFNADGLLDIAVSFSAEESVGIYLQRPGANKPFDQSVNGPIFLDAGPNPFGLEVGDLNGDGLDDIAVTSRSSNTVNVFFQR